MDCPCYLRDATAPLLADTSVVINLNATRSSSSILEALPNRFIVVQQVVDELEAGRPYGRTNADTLRGLVAADSVRIVSLEANDLEHFIRLVSGPTPQTLDDGEAATIAYAVERGAIALIDERKANRLCAERYSGLRVGCTLDLFLHDAVTSALGPTGLRDAVYNALHYGRMRVPEPYLDWVISLIGIERARKCPSLPRSIRCP